MDNKVNFFIIGQPKTGTTSIYHYLKKHPQIYLPEQKQLHHFASDHNQYRQQFKSLNRAYYKKYYNYTYASYIKRFNFSTNKNIYGDITPDYFYSDEAPENIYNYNKNSHIIAIIREPLDFLKSFHLQMINSGDEKEKDFFKALKLEKKRSVRNIMQSKYCPNVFFEYSKLINYESSIDNYYKLFGKKFKVIIYEDFKKNNQLYLNEILNFLSLEPMFFDKIIRTNISHHKSGKLRSIKKLYLLRLISSLIPWSMKNSFKRLTDKKHRMKVDEVNRALSMDEIELKRDFMERVEDLNVFLNENNLILGERKVDLMKKWGYDKLSWI
ncbi:MAG: sulfotransferase [Ignavibacteria bacterium]|nr:sulfotransferase [Ignavibacteria bacterium]